MFQLLGFLFIIIIVVLIIGLTLVGSVLRTIFGFGRRSTSRRNRTYTTSGSNRQYTHAQEAEATEEEAETASEDNPPRKRKKIFTKDEGEYVDFEEIKE